MMKWTFERLIEECRKLRAEADEAESRLFLFLWRIETTPELVQLVEDAGMDFHRFVEHEICERHSRYTRFKDGFERLGRNEEVAVKLGTDAVIETRRVVTPAKLPEYVEAVTAWVEEKGKRPSAETAHEHAAKVDPRASIPPALQRKTKMQQLEAENRTLRARVKHLEAENRALRKKIERSVVEAAKSVAGSGGSRKPVGKGAESKAA